MSMLANLIRLDLFDVDCYVFFGSAWVVMVWFGLVMFVKVWHGSVWFGLACLGSVWLICIQVNLRRWQTRLFNCSSLLPRLLRQSWTAGTLLLLRGVDGTLLLLKSCSCSSWNPLLLFDVGHYIPLLSLTRSTAVWKWPGWLAVLVSVCTFLAKRSKPGRIYIQQK